MIIIMIIIMKIMIIIIMMIIMMIIMIVIIIIIITYLYYEAFKIHLTVRCHSIQFIYSVAFNSLTFNKHSI